MTRPSVLNVSPEVSTAFTSGTAVVALESSVFAQGLPIPENRRAAELMQAAVRRRNAVPAVTAILDGVPRIGLSQAELDRLLTKENVSKVSSRDLAWAMETRANGATTVASTLSLCCLAGMKYFATGGIGGVHREPAFDESADLLELSRSQVLVVCSGAKSILNLPATMERLESLGVSIIGYRTTEMPGFFTMSTGIRLASCTSSLLQVVGAWRAHVRLRRPGAMLVVQAPPASLALNDGEVNGLVERSYERARKEGVTGAAVTPYLLNAIASETGGRSLAVNVGLLEQNAALAGQLAAAIAMTGPAIE